MKLNCLDSPMTPPLTRSLILSALTLAVTLMAGCAAPTLTPQARSHYDVAAQAVAKEGAALVVDSCMYRLEVGTSHIYPQLSEQHAQALSKAASASLQARGVKLKAVHSPFVCSGLESEYVLSLKQANAVGAELKPIGSYPLRTSTAMKSADDEALLLSLMKAVAKAPTTNDRSLELPVKPVALDLTGDQAQALIKLLGSSNVWLVDARQQDVSIGRIMSMITLTAGLSMGLTGGTYASWSTNEDAIGETTALVDLNKREMLWKRQVSGTGRGIVDFERPMPTEQQLRNWADTSGFSPFY